MEIIARNLFFLSNPSNTSQFDEKREHGIFNLDTSLPFGSKTITKNGN